MSTETHQHTFFIGDYVEFEPEGWRGHVTGFDGIDFFGIPIRVVEVKLEDGEVWSQDGRLLAQSRQLAVLVPPELAPPAG